jgi:hypothetical protein
MTIITHLTALIVGAALGIGLMALLVASRNAEDERRDR